jgi:Holliday junction resolvase
MEVCTMAERDIVAAILRYTKTVPDCFAWKTHGDVYSTKGIPDIIACVAGRFIALEVKQSGGRATKLQAHTLHQIAEAGGTAQVVTSLQEAKRLVQHVREEMSNDG